MAEQKRESLLVADREAVVKELGEPRLLDALARMLMIRNFEVRAESAYQQGKIGGFLHSYSGQEAIAVGAAMALSPKDWWAGSYRCHGLALVLGASPDELMAELFGRANGNAGGRGGSMHLYTERLLGGSGIVGGQIPIAIGAAFSAKYRAADEIAVCFMGDGAVAQGAFHESLNLAALQGLPCLFVIENNLWGMGTSVERAISVQQIAEKKAIGYGIRGYTCDGMDLFACYDAFKRLRAEIQTTGKPVIVEMITERFRGHSVSDPGLYRPKELLKEVMANRDPIANLFQALQEHKMIDEEGYKRLDKEMRERVIKAVAFADASPWPDLATLEEGVFAP